MRRIVLSLAALIATTDAPSWAEDAAATTLLERGIALRRDHRDEEALAAFEAADRLEPSALATAQMGLAEQALGRWSEAEANLVSALRHVDDPWIRRHHAALEGALATVETQLGWLDIASEPPDAQVVLQGHAVRVQDGPFRVQIGETALLILLPGYVTAAQSATIRPGQHTRIHVVLEPEPLARDRTLAAAEGPKTKTETPRPESSVGAGQTISATSTVGPKLPPQSPSSGAGPARAYATALILGGSVVIGAGLLFGWQALNAKGTRDLRCSGQFCDTSGLLADHDARTWAAISTASFIFGGAAAMAGTVWLVLSPRVRVAPTIGRTTGFSLQGTL